MEKKQKIIGLLRGSQVFVDYVAGLIDSDPNYEQIISDFETYLQASQTAAINAQIEAKKNEIKALEEKLSVIVKGGGGVIIKP